MHGEREREIRLFTFLLTYSFITIPFLFSLPTFLFLLSNFNLTSIYVVFFFLLPIIGGAGRVGERGDDQLSRLM